MKSQVLEKKVVSAKHSLEIVSLNIEGYEQVLKVVDSQAGLTAIIAIHNTALGPALGGIRIYPYATFDAALKDVLRLAKGMTYKSAVAGVGFGGGKSVIIADPKKNKTAQLLLAFGAAVEQLQGQYICAEDVGCCVEDVKIVRKATRYVVGLPNAKSSGDPGPFTAWGTYRGICATAKHLFGTDSLEGRTVAVQGLGNVGTHLVSNLFWAGANVIVADLDMIKAQKLASQFRVRIASASEILQAECDILAPCAMGAVLNNDTVAKLRCKAVAGCANNQLLDDSHADVLRSREILYAPDFVINAGGLLNVAAELEEEGYNPALSRNHVNRIYNTLTSVYTISDRTGESTHDAAVALANYRIRYGVGKRVMPPTFHHIIEE